MEKILVTQALNELKLLDSRINRAIETSVFVSVAKTSESKVNPSLTKDDFIKNAVSSFSSVNDLIKRREIIKSAIVKSNAETYIEICGKNISVAEAIDMKSTIEYKKFLLKNMIVQRNNSIVKMESCNSLMENKIDSLVTTAFGKDTKNIKESDYDSIAKPYRNSNEVSIVDPLDINKKIEELEDFIGEFESNVDARLQVSNCVTYIEI